MALYRGERDTPDAAPTPQDGHRSNVQVLNMARCGPVFGKTADWRTVVSPQKGSVHLALDYIRLDKGQHFTHEPIHSESIYVLKDGCAEVKDNSGETHTLEQYDVLFLAPHDSFSLSQAGDEQTAVISCRAVAASQS